MVEYLRGYSTTSAFSFGERKVVAMRPESIASRWESLQAKAHLPEVQALIRREISRGDIRVVPAPGGGIQIIPTNGTMPVEEPVSIAASGLPFEHEEDRKVPIPRMRMRAR